MKFANQSCYFTLKHKNCRYFTKTEGNSLYATVHSFFMATRVTIYSLT